MRRIIAIIFIIIPLPLLFSFPDNHEARTSFREIITAPTSDVLESKDRRVEQLSDGSKVSFQVKKQNDSFYLLFINESDGRFPLYSKGSYIIKRNLSDGKFEQIKVFLKDHTECFARIYPMDERAMMEIVLYGKKIYQNINLPFSFADVLTGSFDDVIDSSEGIVDWDLIIADVDYNFYNSKQKLSTVIRNNLTFINDKDDGAIDADGSWVFIDDLQPQPEGEEGFNCSGFVKWVADGLYKAETGNYMSVADLKSKHLDERGNRWSARHEDDRDPYFGLDWTRNIAVELADAKRGVESDYKSTDVTDVKWTSYVEDVGYPIEDLKLLMYYLAVVEPFNIYLASVNVPWGTAPILRQHVHTAVLVPVIDEYTGFNDTIFERNTESNAEILIARYPGAHIHLTRVSAGGGFYPPDIERIPSIRSGSYFRR